MPKLLPHHLFSSYPILFLLNLSVHYLIYEIYPFNIFVPPRQFMILSCCREATTALYRTSVLFSHSSKYTYRTFSTTSTAPSALSFLLFLFHYYILCAQFLQNIFLSSPSHLTSSSLHADCSHRLHYGLQIQYFHSVSYLIAA